MSIFSSISDAIGGIIGRKVVVENKNLKPVQTPDPTVDINKLSFAESSNNPNASAVGRDGKTYVGSAQIGKQAWDDVNTYVRKPQGLPLYSYDEKVKDQTINKEYGNSYINARIPQILKSQGIADTRENRLAMYGGWLPEFQKAGGDISKMPKSAQTYFNNVFGKTETLTPTSSSTVEQKPFATVSDAVNNFFSGDKFSVKPLGSSAQTNVSSDLPGVNTASPGIKDTFNKPSVNPFNIIKDVAQSVFRAGGSAALTVTNTPELPIDPTAPQYQQKAQRALFGNEPIKSYATRIAEGEQIAKGFGLGKTSLPAAFVGVLGGDALNFLGGEGEAGKFVTELALEGDATKVAEKMVAKGFAKDVAEAYAPKIAASTDKQLVEEALGKATDLQLGTKTTGLVGEAGKIPSGMKESGFVETVANAGKTAPEVAKNISSPYLPITNQATLDTAKNLVDTNVDEAVRLVHSSEPATAHSNTVGQLLIDKFQNEGNYQGAIDVVESLAKKARSQGQAIQALSMYNRLSPEGVLKYAQRVAGDLTPKVAEDIVTQAKKIKEFAPGTKENIIETARLLQKIGEQVPKTLLEKVSYLQTLAQLLNPKTAIRNIGGNLGFAALENIKDVPAAALDSALSLITGNRTKALPSLTTQVKSGFEGLVQGVTEALQGIDTSQVPTQFNLPKSSVFKGAVGKGLQTLLDVELKAPDRAFYKAAYDGSLYQQLKAAGISVATDAMKEVAHYDALYRTFQDDSVVSYIFSGLKKALNAGKEFGLGDFVLKYPKTPGNILARGIDYSPAGFAQTVYEAAKPLIGKGFDQKAFVESFSRALTGTTGLIGTGALLHRMGIITGKSDADPDVRGLQRTTGLGQYQINVSGLKRFVLSGMSADAAKLQSGDKLISYDWFQPAAIGVSIGANIDDGKGKGGTVMDFLKHALSSLPENLAQGVNTLAEQPLVSGLTRPLRKQDVASSLVEIAKSIPASFVPTFLSQINQLIDNTDRNQYSPNATTYGLNLVKAKIPGLAQTLPPKVSVTGEDLQHYQNGNNIFNVFFNPAFTSNYKPTPEAQMVLDLMNQTGEKSQFPHTVSNSQKINGKDVQLNARQVNALQRYVGTVTKQLFDSFAQDEQFSQLDPEEKVKYLQNVLTDVGAAGKIIVLGNRPAKTSARVQQLLEMQSH